MISLGMANVVILTSFTFPIGAYIFVSRTYAQHLDAGFHCQCSCFLSVAHFNQLFGTEASVFAYIYVYLTMALRLRIFLYASTNQANPPTFVWYGYDDFWPLGCTHNDTCSIVISARIAGVSGIYL